MITPLRSGRSCSLRVSADTCGGWIRNRIHPLVLSCPRSGSLKYNERIEWEAISMAGEVQAARSPPPLHSLSFSARNGSARTVRTISGSAAAITGRCAVGSQVTVGEHRYVLTQGSDDICAASAVGDTRPSIREGSEGRRKPTKSSPSSQIPTSSTPPLTETFTGFATGRQAAPDSVPMPARNLLTPSRLCSAGRHVRAEHVLART